MNGCSARLTFDAHKDPSSTSSSSRRKPVITAQVAHVSVYTDEIRIEQCKNPISMFDETIALYGFPPWRSSNPASNGTSRR